MHTPPTPKSGQRRCGYYSRIRGDSGKPNKGRFAAKTGYFCEFGAIQRQRDDNENKICTFLRGGVGWHGRFATRFARIIRNRNPYFYSVSGRFARITRISDSRESPDSRESCESSCEKVNLGQNALFCSIWTQTWSAKKAFLSSKNAPFPG